MMNINGSDYDDDDVDYNDGDDDSSAPVARVLATASMDPQLPLLTPLPSPLPTPLTSLKVSTTFSLVTAFCISVF